MPRNLMRLLASVFAVFALAAGLPAQQILVGGPADAFGNLFPFGGPVTGPGTRYQQAYSSDAFQTEPAFDITGIDFFSSSGIAGTLYGGVYQLSLSTIETGIDSLSNTDFASNLGPDNTVFSTVTLSGTAPEVLSFTGGPFFYDSTQGNLLLDIQISGAAGNLATASFQERMGTASGIFSRYQDFGTASIGWGLVTQFDTFVRTAAVPRTFAARAPVEIPEPGTQALLALGTCALLAVRCLRGPHRRDQGLG